MLCNGQLPFKNDDVLVDRPDGGSACQADLGIQMRICQRDVSEDWTAAAGGLQLILTSRNPLGSDFVRLTKGVVYI